MTLTKTPAGQQALKDRSIGLSMRQRAALILVDGKRSVDEIVRATEATPEDIAQLFSLQLVQDTAPAPAAAEAPPAPMSTADAQERYAAAYLIAAKLTGSLGLRGFRLNLAVEGATNYDDLVALAPRILEAVGPEKFKPLQKALQLR
jgi:hypothetical protein